MKKKIVSILLIGILLIGLTGCKNTNYLNGEYVYLDNAFASYDCNEDECIFDMSSIYPGGEFVEQTYVYKLEEKGKNVYKVHFTNKENGQEHTATWNKEEDNLYVEDLKINCRKTININKEVNTAGLKIKMTNIYSDKNLSYNINEFDNNFLLTSSTTTDSITALDNYNFLGFEYTLIFNGAADYSINLYELFSAYNKNYEKYDINELWCIGGRAPLFQENINLYFSEEVKDVPFVYRGYFTIPEEEEVIYIKVNDDSKEIYSISLKNIK